MTIVNYLNPQQAVAALLQDAFSNSDLVTTFYEGDPSEIGQSSLPAICVVRKDTQYDYGPTGFDKLVHTVQIRVVLDKRDEMGNPDSDRVDTTNQKLNDIIDGRDPSTGQFRTESVMGVLRGHVEFSVPFPMKPTLTQVDQALYYVVPKTMQKNMITDEAHINVTITELVAVSRV